MMNPYEAIENTSTPTTTRSTSSTTTSSTTTSSTSSTSSTGTSSTSTRTRAREAQSIWQDTINRLIVDAEHCLGQQITPYIQQDITKWLYIVSPEVITYALHQTAMAPRPSWRYAAAILRRCQQDGITDALALSTQTLVKPKPKKTVIEQQYEQREYQDTDEMPEWMMKAWKKMQSGES